jgi:hypothetical protein
MNSASTTSGSGESTPRATNRELSSRFAADQRQWSHAQVLGHAISSLGASLNHVLVRNAGPFFPDLMIGE